MSRREAWLTAVAIFVVAFLVRLVFASQIVFPKPEDTAYYVGVAQNLVEGRGLVTDAIWSFQTPPLEFPRAAFEIWLPLPTFLAAVPMLLFGATFAAAQWSSVLAGAIVPVLAWRLAADMAAEYEVPIARARVLAIGSGLTAAVYLPLLLHSALPDSTMPFTVFALSACLLMARFVAHPGDVRLRDPRAIAVGLLIGLAALTRNEAVYIGLAWAIVVWRMGGVARGRRVAIIVEVAVIAGLIFLPWAVRDWLVFGSPLPGQAVANALAVNGTDVFAWNDPPTLARYLAVGPIGLVGMRIGGIVHNLFNVLLLPGLPISVIGLVGLYWTIRSQALRPVVIVSFTAFIVTSLVFPVTTTWGTFLHASGPFQVLLVVSALFLLDGLIEEVSIRRKWTNPNAWLGAVLGIFGSLLFSIVLLPTFASGSRDTARLYEVLGERMAAIGHPIDPADGPIISNYPIWMAETQGVYALGLPDEPPRDVVDLADHFGSTLLILVNATSGHWPADLEAGVDGSGCFHEVDLQHPDSSLEDPLADTRVFEIACP